MKRIIFFLLFSLLFIYGRSQNTFPSTGNVGIGTTAPGVYALNIQGSNTDGGVTNAPGINVSNTSTFLPAGSGYNMSWITFNSGNGNVIGQFLSNYGVGATAPYSAGSGLYITTRTNHPIMFGTGAPTSEKMRLTNTGNLGIGNTNPAGVLSLPNVDASNSPVGITWYSTLGDPTQYGIHRTSGAWSPPNYQQIRIGWPTGIVLDPGTSYGLSYVNVVGNGIRVPTGTIGIGTISTNDPNYKLFVEAGIRTRMIKVDQAVWPDYVFNPSYSLLSLEKLKSYIKINKHLPDIASSDDVKKNGVDLGANQAALLKKVEELTLYIIEQDKEIKSLQLDVVKLKEQTKK